MDVGSWAVGGGVDGVEFEGVEGCGGGGRVVDYVAEDGVFGV